MSILETTEGLARLLDPLAGCFSSEVAKKVAALEADVDVQARIDELAEKSNEGTLTDNEDAEYMAYIRAMDVVAVLQKKARQISDVDD
jgi:hypothetical protein